VEASTDPCLFLTLQSSISGKSGPHFIRVLDGKMMISNYRLSGEAPALTCLKARAIQIDPKDKHPWLWERAPVTHEFSLAEYVGSMSKGMVRRELSTPFMTGTGLWAFLSPD
jgi:hypothetical protein